MHESLDAERLQLGEGKIAVGFKVGPVGTEPKLVDCDAVALDVDFPGGPQLATTESITGKRRRCKFELARLQSTARLQDQPTLRILLPAHPRVGREDTHELRTRRHARQPRFHHAQRQPLGQEFKLLSARLVRLPAELQLAAFVGGAGEQFRIATGFDRRTNVGSEVCVLDQPLLTSRGVVAAHGRLDDLDAHQHRVAGRFLLCRLQCCNKVFPVTTVGSCFDIGRRTHKLDWAQVGLIECQGEQRFGNRNRLDGEQLIALLVGDGKTVE